MEETKIERTNEVVLFKADNQDFPMEIIDANGEKWVTSQHLAKAIGIRNIHALHKSLVSSGEIKEGVHFCSRVTLEQVDKNGVIQERKITAYSYRGIIRMAMRAQSKRAIPLRDWAEDVLYEVMVTGTYGIARPDGNLMQIEGKIDQLQGTIDALLSHMDPMGSARMLEETKAKAIKREYGSKTQWVLDIIRQYPQGILVEELYTVTDSKTDKQKATIRATAGKLKKKGLIEKPGVGVYKAVFS